MLYFASKLCDVLLSINMGWNLLCRWYLNQECTCPEMPKWVCRWSSGITRWVVMKAVLRSSGTRRVTLCWFILSNMSFMTCISLVSMSRHRIVRLSWVWLNTASSTSLKANERLLIGHRLLIIASALGFFGLGWMLACFQLSGKQSVCNNRFNILVLVRTGKWTSRQPPWEWAWDPRSGASYLS